MVEDSEIDFVTSTLPAKSRILTVPATDSVKVSVTLSVAGFGEIEKYETVASGNPFTGISRIVVKFFHSVAA